SKNPPPGSPATASEKRSTAGCRLEPAHPLCFSLDLPRSYELRFRYFEYPALILHRTEKARLVAFVTRHADLLDLNQQRVAVAVERDVSDVLHVPAGLPFHPEFLARAAPEMRPAGLEGLFQRRAVHPRHHQHAAGGLLLDYGRDETIRVEFQSLVDAHVSANARQPSRIPRLNHKKFEKKIGGAWSSWP